MMFENIINDLKTTEEKKAAFQMAREINHAADKQEKVYKAVDEFIENYKSFLYEFDKLMKENDELKKENEELKNKLKMLNK